jgi:hypothetical protein
MMCPITMGVWRGPVPKNQQAEPTGDQTTDAIDDGDADGAALRRVGGMLEQAHQNWPQLTLATDRLDNRR